MKTNTAPVIWIHAASLGEFEQGRPVMEQIKSVYTHHRILLTFFSPSGYRNQKNTNTADWVFYLPDDTLSKSRAFLEITKPVLALFIKYEFWYNYIYHLHQFKIPLIFFSVILRSDHLIFKPYGTYFKNLLRCSAHIYVQNQSSQDLLIKAAFNNVTLAGDTRFDRVIRVHEQRITDESIKLFSQGHTVMVVGSSWREDIESLRRLINEWTDFRFIIAPHLISEDSMQHIEKISTRKCSRYSNGDFNNSDILIIDNIGMLSSLYGYGKYAFIGGAFGDGLHNILEAAVYGIPIFFGDKNFQTFQEAQDLVQKGLAHPISHPEALTHSIQAYEDSEIMYRNHSSEIRNYVLKNAGATQHVFSGIKQQLN
jgi:3-deoxy-D-manno-octulosonic-acid transferase